MKMKTNKKFDWIGLFLAGVTGASLLAAMLLATLLPRIILPRPDLGTLTALSLVALLLDHYLIRDRARRDYRLVPVYGVLIFGLFPLAACYVAPTEALLLALIGGVSFTVTTFLFDALTDRLADTPASKAAPVIGAFGLFLAAQCLAGIL